jgi:sugar lactone lactonase YvrE
MRVRTLLLGAIVIAVALCGRAVRADGGPSINKIGPDLVSVGDSDFSLKIKGENFKSDSIVLLDGVATATTFVDKTQLYGYVPASTLVVAGSHTVAVRNSDGVTSNVATLTVGSAPTAVTIIRLNPDSQLVAPAGLVFEMRVIGGGFSDKSKVLVFGRALETARKGDDTLVTFVPTTEITRPSYLPVQVKDGELLSNLVTLPVYDKPASISNIDPANVKAGSTDVKLKINGNGFDGSATVLIDDLRLAPATLKSQQITLTLPNSITAAPSEHVIYVEQSTGLSNAALLRVNPTEGPFIYEISPVDAQAGSPDTTVTIRGANFSEDSEVLVNNDKVKTTFIAGGRLSFEFKESQLTTAGVAYAIVVRNKGGALSAPVSFPVVDPAVVSLVAGHKLDGFIDGMVDGARFRWPSRMALGPDGYVYVADQLNHAIRRLDPETGEVVTVVGIGVPGYIDSGDSTEPELVEPRFNNPLGIAVGPDGTLYIADYGNNVIRRARPGTGGYTVDTIAGVNFPIKGTQNQLEAKSTRRGGSGYFDGPGDEARFRAVDGLALASDGMLYVADAFNHYIRAVDVDSPDFTVSTVSGIGIAGFADGNRNAARYNTPLDLALSPDESSLYVADFNNNRVRQLNLADGYVSTLAGSGFEGSDAGTTLTATYEGPIGVSAGPDGRVYVADHGSETIREVSADGFTTTLAGQANKTSYRDGVGPRAHFKDPRGVLYDAERGILFVADQGHQRIRQIVP